MGQASVASALRSVGPGSRAVATPYCSTPDTLLRGLAERAQVVPGLTLSSGLPLGTHPHVQAVREGNLTYRTWHVAGPARQLAAEGLVTYVPCRAGDVPAMLSRGVDVALVRLSPPDRAGYCSLGPSASYGRALVDSAALVIAEVDEQLPRTSGEDLPVHVSEIDHLVDSDTPTPTYRRAPTSPETEGIANRLVELLPEDATLQLGIGAVPETVAAVLARSGATGLRFVGLACDAMAGMVSSAGAVASVTAVELMGSSELLAAADRNPAVQMASSSRIHDPRWLATLPRLVSICSGLQVDLTGQVASESIGDTLVAGVGGSVDFFEGAHLSSGGLRIVALLATTTSGRSRIVTQLGEGTPVMLPRHGVDVVVTEFGAAVLTGRSLPERADVLRAIARSRRRQAQFRNQREQPRFSDDAAHVWWTSSTAWATGVESDCILRSGAFFTSMSSKRADGVA